MSDNVVPFRRPCPNPECDPDHSRPCRECLQRMADDIGEALGGALDRLADGAEPEPAGPTPGCGCITPGVRIVRD